MTMRLPEFIRRCLLTCAYRVMLRRAPDFVVGADYLRRWWIMPRNRWINIYLHEFRADDDDRALHDHPWASCSILLAGWYIEHIPADARDPAGATVARLREAGGIHPRRARAAHRIQIGRQPAISLFVTGPRVREWGFWCPRGWRHWRQFTAPGNKGRIGRGCD